MASSGSQWRASAAASATGKKRWCPTQSQDEAVFMLTEYTSVNESYMTALGSHSKTLAWILEGGGRSDPVKIGFSIEKSMMGKAEIQVTEGERSLFPTGGGRAILSHDFIQRWNFCGLAPGINELHRYEALITPPHDSAMEAIDAEESLPPPQPSWYPATVKRQLEDGNSFEVLVTMPDGNGRSTEVLRSPVNGADLRDRFTQKRIDVPLRFVKLAIPTHDPLQAALTTDNGEPIINFISMPTPAGADAVARSTLTIRVDQYRTSVLIDTDAAAFAQFMAHEAFRGQLQSQRSSKSWALQIGPFAEHSIVIEKGRQMGVLQLSVDGRRLVESSAEDLGCGGGPWLCNFRFVGKNVLNFIVFETNQYGVALGTQGTVPQETMVEHTCSIHVPSTFDLSSAVLRVNGMEFDQLPAKPCIPDQKNHTVALESLRQEYGIHVPYKVNEEYFEKTEPPPMSDVSPIPQGQQHPQPPKSVKSLAQPASNTSDTPDTGLSGWFKGIWHACYGNLRVPSGDEGGIPASQDGLTYCSSQHGQYIPGQFNRPPAAQGHSRGYMGDGTNTSHSNGARSSPPNGAYAQQGQTRSYVPPVPPGAPGSSNPYYAPQGQTHSYVPPVPPGAAGSSNPYYAPQGQTHSYVPPVPPGAVGSSNSYYAPQGQTHSYLPPVPPGAAGSSNPYYAPQGQTGSYVPPVPHSGPECRSYASQRDNRSYAIQGGA